MISERLRKIRQLSAFIADRSGDYVELLGIELSLYRSALITTLISSVALLFCAIGTLVFVSIATLLSFWDTEHRVLTAWIVAGCWLLITLVSLAIAAKNAPKESPFTELSRQIHLDTAAVRNHYDQDRPAN